MDFEQAASIPLVIWAFFTTIMLIVLIVSICNHGLDTIRIGLFLNYTTLIIVLVAGAITTLLEAPPLAVTAPWAVWITASMGAAGAIIITKWLFSKNG